MSQPEVIVVGAGALGASTAFYLTALGARTTILDHGVPGAQTTARAAGQAMHVHSSDELSRIGIRSVEMFKRFPEDVGRHLDFVQSGSVKVARNEADAAQLRDEIDRGKRLGIEIDLIDAAGVRDLAPWFSPADGSLMWFTPHDLYVEYPETLPKLYVSAAAERGAAFVRGKVAAIDPANATVTMSDGQQRGADALVIAAGAWTRGLVPSSQLATPAWPVRHQVLITQPLATVHRHQPSVRVIDAKTYTRPHIGGLMLGGYEATPWAPDRLGDVGDVVEAPTSEAVMREIAGRIGVEVPDLLTAPAAEVRAGLPTMSPDGHYVIDRLPQAPRTWVVTGCNVAGFSPSPALGSDVAEWIVTGARPTDIESFGLDRLTGDYSDDAAVRKSAVAMYADKYSYDELLEHR